MKINEITVGRKFNLGNYETLELRISVSPSPSEDAQAFEIAVDEIIKKVNDGILKIKEKLPK